MKKQILILVLAIFAIGFSSTAFGQLAPNPVTCLSPNALHPIAGQPYTYSITVPDPVPGTAWTDTHYQWFVTQSTQIIDAGGFAAVVSANGGALMNVTGGSDYNVAYNGAGTSASIEITWNAFAYDPTAPVFVGILVVGTNGACTPNNMKIYKIEPLHAFTLDIANVIGGAIMPGYGDNDDNCIADIVSANINTTFDAVLYDFGENVFYYAVAAANWSTAWQLSVQFANIQVGQTVTLEWATDLAFTTPHAIGVGAGPHVSPTLVTPQGGGTSVGTAGETIYIRATIDHGNLYEGLEDVIYTLSVNGVLTDGTIPLVGAWYDIDFASCAQVDFDDLAVQTLKARPTITDDIPPAGNDYLPIQP